MTKERVAFLGPVSSYSHQAALGCFPEAEFELVPVVTIRDIFEAVQSGTASRGVVPFENSTNGSVVFTLDLFADRELSYPDISVCGEIYHDVHHYLLGHKSSTLPQETDGASTPTPAVPQPLKPRTHPLSSLDKIQRIYSHPQAFGQCELFLGAYLKGIERIDVSSTSKAAELVKEDTTGTSAAIASQAASVVHKLDVLASGIEDTSDNTTRFFVLRKGLENDKVDDAGLFAQAGAHEKSLVSFTVDHKSPGALADALDSFKKYQLNLTSINSRPSRIRPFQSLTSEPERLESGHLGQWRLQQQVMASVVRRVKALRPGISRTSRPNPPNGPDTLWEPDVCQRMKAKPPNYIFHTLHHSKSTAHQLLETALFPYLPTSVNRPLRDRPHSNSALELPAGYHLVHFPPPTVDLLDDGTDDTHFPGKPWVRRMWAGGSIEFSTGHKSKSLIRRPAKLQCVEKITDAVVKGSQENKKVWLDIRRRISLSTANSAKKAGLTGTEVETEMLEEGAIIERRNLVFMPAKTPAEAIEDVSKPVRTIKATINPDFRVSMVPDANLLFRFSALTFNAHRIHLDREYARNVEGFRNLVVHGPLSLLLMLKVLSSQMGRGQMVKSITYKNLAPLFADEKMTICVKRSERQPRRTPKNVSEDEALVHALSAVEQVAAEVDSGVTKWDVWVENAEGGYAVKGTAETVAPGYVKPPGVVRRL
ncbi:hypothetical protein V495_04688 [Pseudogymnoascus sp. VKM F-4514 (FW-929)]|nr:hypothetical protein V495_04688 [Pseudogymnoascus sp. VKM F-4514 (FW-929)]KFY64981.1 hypothetical protein V497_01531 [Pseudogymnoascus sp. VKM F-4516 (FW-969)]